MAQDAFFREVKIDKMTIGELKSSLLEDLGSKKSVRTEQDTSVQLKKLNENLENLVGKQLQAELEKLNKLIEKVTQDYKKDENKNKNKGISSGQLKKILDPINAMAKIWSKKRASRNIDGLTSDPTRQPIPGRGGRGGGGGGGGKNTVASAAGGDDGFWKRLVASRSGLENYKTRGIGKAAANIMAPFQDTNLKDLGNTIVRGVGTGISAIGAIWGPVGLAISSLVGGFAEGILGVLLKPFTEALTTKFETMQIVWSQTGYGIENAVKELKKFEVLDRDIAETGQSRVDIQKQLMKNAKKGLADEIKLRKVTRTGLQLANQIGSNAEATSDTFTDWSMKLGASNFQLGMMARGMRDIARQTGLTGDNLLNVAKNSEQFMQNMRNAGTFTAAGANNIMGALARGETTGTGPGTQKLLSALSGSIGRADVDDQTRNLLMVGMRGIGADMRKQMLAGTALNNKETVKFLANNFDKLIKQQTGGRSLDQLSPEEAGRISDFVIKPLTGMGLNELTIIVKNLRDMSKSYEEQLDELNKQSEKASTNATRLEIEKNKERLFLSESNIQLEKFVKNMETGKGAGPLGSLGSIDDVLAKRAAAINKRAKEMQLDLSDKNQYDMTPAQILAQAQEALRKNNVGDFKDAIGKLDEIERQIDKQEKNRSNPLQKITEDIERIKNQLSRFVSELIDKFLPDFVNWLEQTMPLFESIMKDVNDLANLILRRGEDPNKPVYKANRQQTTEAIERYNQANLKNPETKKNLEAELSALKTANKTNEASLQKRIKDQAEAESGWLVRLGKNMPFMGSMVSDASKAEALAQQNMERAIRDSKLREKALEAKLTGNTDNLLRGDDGKYLNTSMAAAQVRKTMGSPGVDEKFYNSLKGKSKEEQRKIWEEFRNFTESQYAQEKTQSGSLELLNKLNAAQDAYSKAALEPGSIYVHDIHLVKTLENLFGPQGTATAKVPMSRDADEEIRQRRAAGGSEMGQIEANTRSSAESNKRIIRVLSQIGRMLARNARNKGPGVTVPNFSEDAFFDENLNTEWPNARMTRSVGLEFDYTDFS